MRALKHFIDVSNDISAAASHRSCRPSRVAQAFRVISAAMKAVSDG
jgi:hypothetical protein